MISFDITGTGGFSACVELTEQVSAEENVSVLEARLYIISSRWLGGPYWLQGQAAGRDFSSNYDSVYIRELGVPAQVGQPWSFTVPHEPDGTGSVTVSVSLRGYTTDGSGGNGWRIEGSKTVSLTPIAQASQVSATDGEVGGVCHITITRKDPDYSHLLTYTFGSLQGSVPCTDTAVSWTIPEEFYGELTDSPSGICTLTCTTMDGEKQVGQPTRTSFTVTVPLSCGPLLVPSVLDTLAGTVALTGDASTVVRHMSQVRCSAQCQGQKGAQIQAVTVNGQPVPAVLTGMERYVFKATDSRGYSTEQVVQPKLINYELPTVGGFCSRVDPRTGTARLTVRGSCFFGSFGLRENSLTLTATVNDRVYTLTPVCDSDSYQASAELQDLSYDRDYTVTVTARDELNTATAELTISAGEPVFDWGQRDFAFHVPVTAPRINGIKNPALKAWPVGAVILMENDPGDVIGGKWAHFTLPGIDLDAWRRLQGADVLGTAVLGRLVLGTEE